MADSEIRYADCYWWLVVGGLRYKLGTVDATDKLPSEPEDVRRFIIRAFVAGKQARSREMRALLGLT